MSKIKCSKCQGVVDEKTKICQSCGRKQKDPFYAVVTVIALCCFLLYFERTRVIGFCVTLMAAGGFGAYALGGFDSNSGSQYRWVPPPPVRNDTPVMCPRCGCTQISANPSGFSIYMGSFDSGQIWITCLRCGHKWKPGKPR